VLAWTTAEIAVIGAEGACNFIYQREIAQAPNPVAKRVELVRSYEEQFNNPYFSARMGIIDEIIVPRDTRKRVAVLLEILREKKVVRPVKKHNNMPL
jgi:propionyl-CoA carboxylase beta chain